MFKFLKDKLKSAISKISESVEKEGKIEEEEIERPLVETKTAEAKIEDSEEKTKKEPSFEKGFFARIKEKIVGKEGKKETSKVSDIEAPKEKVHEETKVTLEQKPKIEIKHKERKKEEITQIQKEIKKIPKEAKHVPEIKREKDQAIKTTHAKKIIENEIRPEEVKIEEEKPIEAKLEPEKKGFFASIKEKIVTTKISKEQFEKLFWELELALMENNVALEVVGKIKNDLMEQLVEKPIRRTKVEETIMVTLKSSIGDLFQKNNVNLISQIKDKKEKPYVIAFFGINGSGKTTSIAKLAKMLKDSGISCVMAASDTFRAASIEQLQLHADKIGVNLIKHNYGSDPAAVAFDAIKHAKAKGIDTVLIDTAGRMHSNQNLIDELKKIARVTKPDLKIFVGESIAGNDCIEQAKSFNEAVGIDGIILAKADVDEKGGAAVSVSYVTKKPILFLGVGQEYSDLEEFSEEKIMRNIGL